MHDRAQAAALVADLRSAVGRPDAPVLIDQEGGRVQRLRPARMAGLSERRHLWPSCTTATAQGLRAAWLGARLIADDLSALGITVDCLPLADVPVAGADDVIGDRAYGMSRRRWRRSPAPSRTGLRPAASCRC